MKAVGFSVTFVTTYQTVQYHIAEESNLRGYRPENLTAHRPVLCFAEGILWPHFTHANTHWTPWSLEC
jgi:hypothetical protein